MYAPIHEYRLNERLYSNVHVHWIRLNADCVYTTKKKVIRYRDTCTEYGNLSYGW